MDDEDELKRLLDEFGLAGDEDDGAGEDRLIDWGWDDE